MTSLEREEGREKENISFSLQYKIQFLHCPSGVSSRIYAAVLNLSTDAPYHPCPDVYVPYLACVDCGGLAEKSSEKCVQFTFFPKQPVPAIFRAHASTNTTPIPMHLYMVHVHVRAPGILIRVHFNL
jgi:hypothetical protein